jgi:hypothetical protein
MTHYALVRARYGIRIGALIFGLTACSNEIAELTGDASAGVSAEALTSSPDTSCTSATSAGREYWFCSTERSWAVARQKCQAVVGRDLVVIETSTENDFVYQHVPDDSWIGATDQVVEGAWRWAPTGAQFWQGTSGGSSVGGLYKKWATGQPNETGGQDCAIIDDSNTGKWSDESCSGSREYVCEADNDQCPGVAKTSPGQCGCAVPDTDGDGDGTADCVDGCISDPTKASAGQCGCGTADTDSDGDGTANCHDGCPNDPAHIAPDCSPESGCTRKTFGGSAYWFCNTTHTWTTARAKCTAAGYQFARIDTAAENGFIENEIASDRWIGGSDLVTEGTWRWETGGDTFWLGDSHGAAVGGAHALWDSGEPSTLGSHDCLQVMGDGEWNADDCNDTEQYICEDLCPADVAKSVPGICGCGTSDVDSNSDGSADCLATAGHQLFGPVFDLWKSLGWENSSLGYPATDTLLMPDGVGYYTHFQNGSILWHPDTGAHAVDGAIGRRWLKLGGAEGFLGYPIADKEDLFGESGANDLDAPEMSGSLMSFALSGLSGAVLRFQGGSVYWSQQTGAHALSGPILARYVTIGEHQSALGFPTSEEVIASDGFGHIQYFEDGGIYNDHHPLSEAHAVWGPIFQRWASLGAESGTFGYPRSDVFEYGDDWAGSFEGGNSNALDGDIWYSSECGISFSPPDCSSGVPGSGCVDDGDCSAGLTCSQPWGYGGRCTRSMETLCPDPLAPDAPENCFPSTERGRVAYSRGRQVNRCVEESVADEVQYMGFYPWTWIAYDARQDDPLPPDGVTVPEYAKADHVQGIARLPIGEDNWMAISMSNMIGEAHNPGGVIFLRLDQVAGHDGEVFDQAEEGERAENQARAYYKVDAEHPSGIQAIGSTLAVAVSNDPEEFKTTEHDDELPDEYVALYDVRDPASIHEEDALLSRLNFQDLYYPDTFDTGDKPKWPWRPSSVAIVKMESGGYVVAVNRSSTKARAKIWLFVTPYSRIDAKTRWYFHNYVEVDTAYGSGGDNMTFVTECDGTVYLLITGQKWNFFGDQSEDNTVSIFKLVKTAQDTLDLEPAGYRAGFLDEESDFRAAGAFYVSPEGQLILYANNRALLKKAASWMAEFATTPNCEILNADPWINLVPWKCP